MLSNPTFLIIQTLNSISLGMNLFIIAAGLTLTFGVLRVINFAHGAFFMIGAYVCFSVVEWSGSFWLGVAGAGLVLGVLAWALERLPRVHALLANRPNPFNPETAIDYELPGAEKVVLEIYNLQGQLVRQLVDGMRSGGRHRAVWDGRDARGKRVGSGIYFYRLETSGFVQTRRMTLVK